MSDHKTAACYMSDHKPQPAIYINIDPGMLLMFRVHTHAMASMALAGYVVLL